MLTCETTIETDRPGRYLAQLCGHAAAMGKTGGGHGPRRHPGAVELARGEVRVHVEHSGTSGVITITPWGRVTLETTAGALTLRVDATDRDGLQRIQQVLTRDLERFGRRDRLTVTWPPPDTTGAECAISDQAAAGSPAAIPRRRRRPGAATILAAVLVAAVVAVHVALGGAILAAPRWTGMSVAIIAIIIAGKVLLVVRRRRRPGRSSS
ncbi:MAG TPA: DUF2218 domain-containing protein [Streptosporangiaceae bacterium]